MKLIDTHCHLYLEEFDADQEALVLAAQQAGISALLVPNVDLTTVERMHRLCDTYPTFAFPMMGLHPTSVKTDYAHVLGQIEALLPTRPYCAIGEIGIDLYWDKTHLKEQKLVFEEQLRWSIDLNLPVAIHTRDAFPEVFDSLYKVGTEKLKGVFHSFTGGIAELEEINRLPQFKIGINGVITFKNSTLSETIQHTNIHQIVLETDAPYLAPAPYRGKRNEPTFIQKTAEKVADSYKLAINEVISITSRNALNLFKTVSNPALESNFAGKQN